MTEASTPVADAPKGNWVDRLAPAAWRPYLQLSRADRINPVSLLLLPALWAIALALPAHDRRLPWLFLLFAVGAVVMRGAGCTFNDLMDRDFDAQVARTRSRPLPSGRITPKRAWAWLIAQCLVGLVVLLQLNNLAIGLGVASLGLIAIYPFAKRFTWWPQVFLGLAFNWGAVLGWAAAAGQVPLASLVLYAGGIAWTLGYDTIYAHQDKEDDALIGVKSTARLFGAATKRWLILFYALTALGIGAAAWLASTGLLFWPLFALGLLHLGWQVLALDIDDPADCLKKFRANRDFGLLILLGCLLGSVA